MKNQNGAAPPTSPTDARLEDPNDAPAGEPDGDKPRRLVQALGLVGELSRSLAGERGQAQILSRLTELEETLRLAWEEQIDLSLKLLELGALNLKYKQQLRLGREVTYEDGFYWLAAPGRAKADGPLCPTCWETEDKLVHLSRPSPDACRVAEPEGWRQWVCGRCNEVFLRRANQPGNGPSRETGQS